MCQAENITKHGVRPRAKNDDNDLSGGTTKHPGGDYLETNTVSNEDDLKPLSLSVTPSMEQGTVTLNSIGKIWTSSTKGDSAALLTLPKTWDLSDATERSNFNSVKYIEGTSNTNGTVSLSFKDGSTTICTANITCYFISANCGDQLNVPTRNQYEANLSALVRCEWSATAPYSTVYNCIAYSIGDTSRNYLEIDVDAVGDGDGDLELSDVVAFYDSKGYEQTSASLATIMYYQNFHAAKKKSCSCGAGQWDMWESKAGRNSHVLEHRKNQLNGTQYGVPTLYFKAK